MTQTTITKPSTPRFGLRAALDGLALTIDGHEFVLSTEEAVRLGEALQRARVCPLCDRLMFLERDGRFPAHECRVVSVAVVTP